MKQYGFGIIKERLYFLKHDSGDYYWAYPSDHSMTVKSEDVRWVDEESAMRWLSTAPNKRSTRHGLYGGQPHPNLPSRIDWKHIKELDRTNGL